MADPGDPARIRADSARIVAIVVQGRSLGSLLTDDPDQGSARGLKRSLCYGTLRWHYRLVAVLRELATQPVERLDPVLAALLEIGLFQLLSGEVPAHAAVAETVNASRLLGFGKAAGFVNAVLRRFQRERESILDRVDKDQASRTAHPRWFVRALHRDRPGAAEAILEANNQHPPFWLRVNRLRGDPDGCVAALVEQGFDARRHEFMPDAVLVTPACDVARLAGFNEGRLSVQDPAAQLAVEFLDLDPGQRILDACAAPGGKTCHMLERAGGRLELTALDRSADRLAGIQQNLARLGLQADLLTGDACEPGDWWDGRPYDAILLDVPCSATGVIRRHPDIKLLRRRQDIPNLASRQGRMLRAAWPLLKPGGTLLYTSCSVLAAENEVVVGGFLAEALDASDHTAQLLPSWFPGMPDPGPGLQVLPGEAGMDGFYYACLMKRG
jgi:16S rRNA (cytosine967-C5)-methyltransferase